ncbi:MAG: class I SAM-dependent methyltransferase [Anaerolineae bacterium]
MSTDTITFDRAAEFYDRTRGFPDGIERDAAHAFIRVGALTTRSRVLEVGVGTGRIALPLAPYVGEYVGIDISRPMMLKLRGKQTGERINLSEGDARVLPYADASFDAVVAVHVFHLIPNWQQALVELKRVLKPDGVLLHGWNRQGDNEPMQQFWRQRERESRTFEGGLSFEQRQTFLADEGWRLLSEDKVDYTVHAAPIELVDEMRNRMWSRCWRLSDEQLAAMVRELEAFLKVTFADPVQIVPVASAFHVQKYAPPAV